VDLILLVSDCSRRGIQAAGRIAEMIGQLDMAVKKVRLIVNRAPGGELEAGILEEIQAQKLSLIGVVPQDEDVYRYDAAGKALIELSEDGKVKKALEKIIQELNI
jgi:CO dehydrogenase maturation factor